MAWDIVTADPADKTMQRREVFTREEVAARWGVNVRTIAREIERGNLTAFRVGRCVRIPLSAIEEYEQGATHD